MTVQTRHLALSVFFVVLALAAGLGLFNLLVSLREAPGARPVLPRVYTVDRAVLERGVFEEQLAVQGAARALRDSRLAAQVQGEVVWMLPGLEAGVHVDAGQELLRIDPSSYENDVQRREGALARTEAGADRVRVNMERLSEQLAIRRREQEIAAAEFDRAKEMRDKAVFSESELESREARLKIAEAATLRTEWELQAAATELRVEEANIKSTQAELGMARIDLERTVIRAPYACEIVSVSTDIGERVAPGQVVLEVVDKSRVEIPIQIAANNAQWVSPGAVVSLSPASGKGAEWTGVVERVAPRVSTSNRSLEAYVVVNNDPDDAFPDLLPGTFVTGLCSARKFQDVFVVPREYFIDGRMFYLHDSDMLEVWLENEEIRLGLAGETIPPRDQLVEKLGDHRADLNAQKVKVARAVQPTVDTYTNGLAIIREGLMEGAEIVASNIDVMYDGAVVRLTDDSAPPSP